MTTTQNDLYTTHLNRRYRKRALVNAGIGLAIAALCGQAYASANGAGLMALVGVLLGIVTFLLPMTTIVGARHPLRLTEQGIVTRYSILRESCLPWAEIAGIGIHPRRTDPCLLRRLPLPGAEPLPFVIGWALIAESADEVMAAVRAELVGRGHVSEEQAHPVAPPETQLVNPLKEFWN